MTGQDWLILLTGMTGTVGFSLLFCLRGKQLPITAAGGALTCLLWLLCVRNGMQSFFALLLASCLGNGYSAVVSRVTKTPKTVFMLAVMISRARKGIVPDHALCSGRRLERLLYCRYHHAGGYSGHRDRDGGRADCRKSGA